MTHPSAGSKAGSAALEPAMKALARRMLVYKVLSWLAFTVAVVGGCTATASVIGAVVASVLGVFWWWLPLLLLVVVGGMIGVDIWVDRIPNRFAIYGTLGWPSLMLSLEGSLGRTLQGWVSGVNGSLADTIAPVVADPQRGSTAVLTALAVLAISVTVLTERKATRARPDSPPAGRR